MYSYHIIFLLLAACLQFACLLSNHTVWLVASAVARERERERERESEGKRVRGQAQQQKWCVNVRACVCRGCV